MSYIKKIIIFKIIRHVIFLEGAEFPSLRYLESLIKSRYQHENFLQSVPMVGQGRKNKRGDRGSTDDETTDSKRPNIAASDIESEELGELQESHPILSDTHEILKKLQKSVSSLSNEVAELKSSFKKQETELRNAKDALKASLESNNQLRTKLQATKKRIKEQEEKIEELYDDRDELEQYSRKNSIEIVGIPESAGGNEDIMLKVAAAINVPVKAENIDICHRVKVAHLDFSETHHPNFERLILNCLSSVGQAASHIY